MDCRRTVVMAHSNHERDILDILRKSLKRPVCYQLTASNLNRQISHFIIFCALLKTCSCFPWKYLMNRTKTESFNQVSCMECVVWKISLHQRSQTKARQTAIWRRKVSTPLASFLSERMAFLKSDKKQYLLNFLWSVLKLYFYKQLVCIRFQ